MSVSYLTSGFFLVSILQGSSPTDTFSLWRLGPSVCFALTDLDLCIHVVTLYLSERHLYWLHLPVPLRSSLFSFLTCSGHLVVYALEGFSSLQTLFSVRVRPPGSSISSFTLAPVTHTTRGFLTSLTGLQRSPSQYTSFPLDSSQS